MARRRFMIIATAAVLTAAVAAPAIAQTDEKLTGLDKARQAIADAVELAADDGSEPAPTIPPGPTGKNQANKGNKSGKGNSGNAPGAAKGNSGNAPGVDQSDPPRFTGKARAAEAIRQALLRENGNGNAFGRGHAAAVIEALMTTGEPPSSLEVDENHGAEVSAMVRAYNELRERDLDD